ncbi:MAG: DUF4065 domain-containing protein [Planctomycetes bacterium]|nr:DUF4065 domain-containing protein [Planctomycetota bacterium]
MESYDTQPITTASDLAQYIINFANHTGELLTNLKLQKLLYYAQGWHLAHYNHLLFSDKIEAWVHGPVVPHLYHLYKNGWAPINSEINQRPKYLLGVDKWLVGFLREYMPIDAFELEQMTHLEKPWLEARGGIPEDEICSKAIDPETMKKYFVSLLNA